MSVVTNIIFTFSIMENDVKRISEVNTFFDCKPLIGVDSNALPSGWYGGSKMLETNIYVGAFNYLDLNAFISHIKTIKWKEPENVQLIVQGDNDEKFKIIDIFENKT